MIVEAKAGQEKALTWPKTILIASPHGFCAGVERSVQASKRLIEQFPNQTGYYVGEPAHNRGLVDGFKGQGVIFVDKIHQVLDGSIVGLGPHGSTPQDLETARKKRLFGIDTQCPLVTKVHEQVKRYLSEGRTVLYFATKDHPEARGVLGHDENGNIIVFGSLEELDGELEERKIDPDKLAFASQTTHLASEALAVQEKLRQRFPQIKIPSHSDVCYATQNRQDAVKAIVQKGAEVVVVLGSKHSSNTTRLAELVRKLGKKDIFVDGPDELETDQFSGFPCVGLTSGASVPEGIFEETLRWFREKGSLDFHTVSVADEKNMSFAPVKIQNF